MQGGVVNLVSELGQMLAKIRQIPHGKIFGIDRGSDLPSATHDLRVATQIMNEARIRHAKNRSQTDRSVARPVDGFSDALYRASKVSKYVLRNSAPLSTTRIWGKRVCRRTHPHDHHAGAVAGRVKSDVDGQDLTRKSVVHRVIHGRPRLLPVSEETSSTSNWVWSIWAISNGRSPCRGVVCSKYQ